MRTFEVTVRNQTIEVIQNDDGSFQIPECAKKSNQWDGWKTPALKPSVENWWLVQKPISESSIARNILKHGVGGLNIEACRIEVSSSDPNQRHNETQYAEPCGMFGSKRRARGEITGRYPANLLLSCGANCKGDEHSPDCPVSFFPETHGAGNIKESYNDPNREYKKNSIYQGGFEKIPSNPNYHSNNSGGSAARFFKQLPFDPETVPSIYYQSKASSSDRSSNGTVKNTHPTVKSRHLMKYLIQLITPKGGTVLDPFCGSGTTALACKELNRNYICIEKEKEYFDIACDRVNQPREYSEEEEVIKPVKEVEFKQLSLFDIA